MHVIVHVHVLGSSVGRASAQCAAHVSGIFEPCLRQLICSMNKWLSSGVVALHCLLSL